MGRKGLVRIIFRVIFTGGDMRGRDSSEGSDQGIRHSNYFYQKRYGQKSTIVIMLSQKTFGSYEDIAA